MTRRTGSRTYVLPALFVGKPMNVTDSFPMTIRMMIRTTMYPLGDVGLPDVRLLRITSMLKSASNSKRGHAYEEFCLSLYSQRSRSWSSFLGS